MSNITIACVGDIMCGDSFYNTGAGVASSLRKYGRRFLPQEIADVLRSHDLVVGNIECVLSDKGRNNRLLRSIQMRGAGHIADYLADWNLTLANVANNHILEHGHVAAIDTVDNLLASGIKVTGSGADRKFNNGLHVEHIHCRDLTVAFIGLCLRREKYAFNGGADLDEVVDKVKTLNASHNFVCICIHWGDEYMDYPSLEQISIAETLTRAGAKMIIGHHPHVIQGIEMRSGALIAYSLGNFIFDSFIDDCCWSVMLSIRVVDGELAGWRSLPIIKDCEHRPALARGRRKATLANEFTRRCELLKTTAHAGEYQQRYADDFQLKDAQARRNLRRHLCRTFPQMDAIYWPQILFRPIQRRLRIW